MIDRADITGVILCGGDARRMSGVEKPLQRLDDAPIVSHVHARLAPQVARVVISANRFRDEYASYADQVVPDAMAGAGPLGGLLSALDALRGQETPYVFACPGDAPFLDPSLVSRLARALADTDADVAVPHDGTRSQHLFLLMRTTGEARLRTYLETGERSVHGWMETQHTAVADAADIATSFANINTAQELQHAQEQLRGPSHSQEQHTHLHQDQEPL